MDEIRRFGESRGLRLCAVMCAFAHVRTGVGEGMEDGRKQECFECMMPE